MLLTIQSTLLIPHLCSSSWSQFPFFLFFFFSSLLSGEFPSEVSQSHLQAENKTLIWLFSDVASIGLQQKVILQDVMLSAFCSFRNHKPVCLKNMTLSEAPSLTHRAHLWGWFLSHVQTCFFKEAAETTLFAQICEPQWEGEAGHGGEAGAVSQLGTVLWTP